MWRAGSLEVTDEIRHDGKRVRYPVSKIRRGLETSRTAVVGYAVLASILVALISWVLYLVFHCIAVENRILSITKGSAA